MYFHPKEHICKKCNSNLMWSIHHDPLGYGIPFCMFCFKDFLVKNIPIMEEKINPTKGRSNE